MKRKEKSMLEKLHDTLKILPLWLNNTAGWNSLYIDYEKPYVERLWRQWGKIRVYLHIIHPCMANEVFFHNHAAKSAMKIVKGKYLMESGYIDDKKIKRVITTSLYTTGSEYEMTLRSAMHSVQPIGGTAMTIMISAPKWPNHTAPKPTKELYPLNDIRVKEILELFKAELIK